MTNGEIRLQILIKTIKSCKARYEAGEVDLKPILIKLVSNYKMVKRMIGEGEY